MKRTTRVYITAFLLVTAMIFSGCGKSKKSDKDSKTYVNRDGVTVTRIEGDGKIADQMSETYAAIWNGFETTPPVKAEVFACEPMYGDLRAAFTDAETIGRLYEEIAAIKLVGRTDLVIEDASYTGVAFVSADGGRICVYFEVGYFCMEGVYYEYEGSKKLLTELVNEKGAYWREDTGDYEQAVHVKAGAAEFILYLKKQAVVGVAPQDEAAKDLIYYGALMGLSRDDAYELIVQEARDHGYIDDGSEAGLTEIR